MVMLRERGTDVRIARVPVPVGPGTVVVKLWNRPGWRGAMRRLTRTNIGFQEYQTLRRLEPQHIGTPRPIAYLRLRDPATPYTEALVSSDLGECRDATEFFKALLRAGRENEAHAFEDAIIRSTAGLLASGLIDTDHRLPNFVVTPQDQPVRLDFELCRATWCVALYPRSVGLMLGTLLGSYAFAVQPDMARVPAFAARLRSATRPSARSRQVAAARLAGMLARQEREIGLRMTVPDPWSAPENTA
jgi:hypothetical protein